MDRESAEQWNARHLKGTIVSVSMRSGETISAPTATHAQQWGELAPQRWHTSIEVSRSTEALGDRR